MIRHCWRLLACVVRCTLVVHLMRMRLTSPPCAVASPELNCRVVLFVPPAGSYLDTGTAAAPTPVLEAKRAPFAPASAAADRRDAEIVARASSFLAFFLCVLCVYWFVAQPTLHPAACLLRKPLLPLRLKFVLCRSVSRRLLCAPDAAAAGRAARLLARAQGRRGGRSQAAGRGSGCQQVGWRIAARADQQIVA